MLGLASGVPVSDTTIYKWVLPQNFCALFLKKPVAFQYPSLLREYYMYNILQKTQIER